MKYSYTNGPGKYLEGKLPESLHTSRAWVQISTVLRCSSTTAQQCIASQALKWCEGLKNIPLSSGTSNSYLKAWPQSLEKTCVPTAVIFVLVEFAELLPMETQMCLFLFRMLRMTATAGSVTRRGRSSAARPAPGSSTSSAFSSRSHLQRTGSAPNASSYSPQKTWAPGKLHLTMCSVRNKP